MNGDSHSISDDAADLTGLMDNLNDFINNLKGMGR